MDFIKELSEWIEELILEVCNTECENCNRLLSYPTAEDIKRKLIEDYLRRDNEGD